MINIEKMLIKYNYSKRNSRIEYIVIHDTGNGKEGAGVTNHYNYFNSGNRNASADYFVDDNRIGQFVEDNNKSWHCGDGAGKYGITNDNSIGIETCINADGDYAKALQNTVDLTKHLMAKYNISPEKVVRHYDASRKSCPNSMRNNDWEAWRCFKNMISGNTSTVVPEPPTSSNTTVVDNVSIAKNYLGSSSNTKKVQLILNCFGYNLIVDSECGPATAKAIGEFQRKYNLDVDYKFGPACYNKAYELLKGKVIKKGSTGAEVKLIQTMVGVLSDGIFGTDTERALKEFQKQRGISPDGIVGQITWKYILGIS